MLLDDLVAESTTSTGTGSLTLSSGAGGLRSFATVYSTGSSNKFPYHIRHASASEYEQGIGYMSDATTLVRSRVLKSSNSDAAVSFSAGEKAVVSDLPASVALVALGLARLVYNNSGSAIAANKLVSITGFNSSADLSNIALASRSTNRYRADGFTVAQIEDATAGWILTAGEVTGVDTSGYDDGDPIFLDTSGDWSVGAPSSGYIQEVGNVIDVAASGIIHFRLTQGHGRIFARDWTVSTDYYAQELVVNSDKIYRANTNHTSDSSSFATDAASWDEMSPASSGTGVQLSFFVETPEVKSYTLIGSNQVAWDVDSCTVKSASGTGTYDLEIDGVDITGIAAQGISSTEATDTASAANSLTTGGERLSFNLTANSSLADLEITIKGTST